jgi:hypothetical protein
MKPNFIVDSDFPVIDGVGHGDKIDWCNVKGGGCTNTTLFESGGVPDIHHFSCWLDVTAVSTGLSAGRSYSSCTVDPDFGQDSVANPGCLNGIREGDLAFRRSGDTVLLNHITVSGVLRRPGGDSVSPFFQAPDAPKVLVALVADLKSDGNTFDADKVFDDTSGTASGSAYTTLPWLDPDWANRYRVLAFDVVDFGLRPDCKYDWVEYASGWTNVPPAPTVVDTRTAYAFWRSVSAGFRFDVDLNGLPCRFKSSSGTYASLCDVGLHMVACLFDGFTTMGSDPSFGDYNFVTIQYQSRLDYEDFLTPTAFAPAGVDGGVVPDNDVDPMLVLADASAGLAGLPGAVERPVKRSKASQGFYNFMPRSGDAMLFEDDPEFARLEGVKGASRSRAKSRKGRPASFRRVGDDDDPDPPFEYLPRYRSGGDYESERKGRRSEDFIN